MTHRAALKYAVTLLLGVFWTATVPATAQPGDAQRGERIYQKRCALCHGEQGDADSPAAELLIPPPRDFTAGLYKFKTTAFNDDIPNDDDLFRMIRDGMPATVMPGWADILSERDIRDLVAHIKTFAGYEEEKPTRQVDYGERITASPESIAAGRKLFRDRCVECHGDAGKGDAIKKLKDDAGNRTWPRNLTKPWTFRASNHPKDIFTRISVGIPGTQMPAFADPKSKKRLSVEERWHVANYVASLAKSEKIVRPEKTVVRAVKVAGEAPAAPDDPRWSEATPVTFFLLPQIIAEERHFTPSNDTISVKALYSETDIALLLEWDDRTKSIPGDAKAMEIADEEMGEDIVSVQLPVELPQGMEKPYFLMGDAVHPVTLWRWTSGTADKPQSIAAASARGMRQVEQRDAGQVGLTAKGVYEAGTWRIVMRRPLKTGTASEDLQFIEGRFIPVAFAVWDGSNGEIKTRHTLTTWYWLLLEPPRGSGPLVAALAVLMLLGAAEFWWTRSAAGRRKDKEG